MGHNKKVLYFEEKANPWNRLTFGWVRSLMQRGRKHSLEADDLLPLNATEEPAALQQHIPPGARLLTTLLRWHWAALARGGLLSLCALACQLCIPFLLRSLVDAFAQKQPASTGLRLCALVFLCTLLGSLCTHHMWHILLKMCMRIKAQIADNIFKKSLKILPRVAPPKGDIINLLANDSARIYNVLAQCHQLWSIPLQVGLVLWFLHRLLGWPAWGGLGVLLATLPLSSRVAKAQSKHRAQLLRCSDERVSLMGDVLHAIRLIKFYAWEKNLHERILQVRAREEWQLSRLAFIQSLLVFVFLGTPVVVAFVALGLCFYNGYQISPGQVFSALTLFGLLRQPLAQLPSLISDVTDSFLSEKRLQNFLLLPEIETPPEDLSGAITMGPCVIYHDDTNPQNLAGQGRRGRVSDVYMRRTQVSDEEPNDARSNFQDWYEASTADSPGWQLHVPHLHIAPGELVGVMGTVGSGKTTLLRALFGEHTTINQTTLGGPVAYVPQQPWIPHGSIKDVVLWGKSYVPEHYQTCINACGLGPDILQFSHGHETRVGERGVLLSGGQKQRLSLARAAYADAALYVLDDPLSAVDEQVAEHIFAELICGLWKNKTRLLCTHRHEFLSRMDRVLVVENGTVREWSATRDPPLPLAPVTAVPAYAAAKNDSPAPRDPLPENQTLTQADVAEEREQGAVRWEHYRGYLRHMGSTPLLIGLVILFLSRDAASLFHDHFVARFAAGRFLSLQGFLSIAAGAAGTSVILGLVRAFLLGRCGVRAAHQYQQALLSSVLFTKLSFFENTQTGRILNRFSKDTESLDRTIPQATGEASLSFVTLLSTLLLILLVLPFSILFVIPATGFYFWVQKQFRQVARQVKRLDSVTRSPVFSLISEALDGASVIRAYNKQKVFFEKHHQVLQVNQRAFYSAVSLNRWLGVRLELTSSLFVSLVALVFVTLARDTPAETMGLCVTYALLMTGNLNWTVRMLAELENGFNAVERVNHYTRLTPETTAGSTPENWPSAGKIIVKNLCASYKKDQKNVLQNVNFSINPGERIGLIGRTGSGKSTLTQVFFRLVDHVSGEILIDDINIAHVAPRFVRSRLGIIPQDPQLFLGTIRDNLDPFGTFDDDAIWQSLGAASLETKVRALAQGLLTPVKEGGVNFSVGERQLLCLARAFLRKPRVLFLDEATAHVDPATDALVHKLVDEMAQSATVITIAHRLHTVENTHKVLWLDHGRVRAWGPPHEVLRAFREQNQGKESTPPLPGTGLETYSLLV